MADPKSIHEFLPTSGNIGSLFLVDDPDSQATSGYTTRNISMDDVGEMVNNGIEYTQDLSTENKKVIGAINELNTIVQISASDFFTSDTISGVDTSEFYAYRIGKMVCVERCKLINVSLVSPTYKIVGIKDEYLPSSNIRICGQFDGSGQLDTPYRMYLSPSYKGFGSEKWGTYSAIWLYTFTYFID